MRCGLRLDALAIHEQRIRHVLLVSRGRTNCQSQMRQHLTKNTGERLSAQEVLLLLVLPWQVGLLRDSLIIQVFLVEI